MKDNIKLTKKERLEAYDKILGDDEDYINSFLNTDKFQSHIYNEKDGNKPFFEGYKPNYYFNKESEDLTESQIKDLISKAIITGKDKFASCTSLSSKGFTLDDLNKAIEQLEKLPLSPIEIEISYTALQVLLGKIPTIKDIKGINMMYGIPVSIVEGGDFKFNQMKIKYSDGNSKIIDVFTWNDNINIYDIVDKEDK